MTRFHRTITQCHITRSGAYGKQVKTRNVRKHEKMNFVVIFFHFFLTLNKLNITNTCMSYCDIKSLEHKDKSMNFCYLFVEP